jgi:probable phosphoglycerate mutase
MARCREFAVELAGRLGLPLAVEPGLIEIGMGAWEGRSHEDVAAREPAAYRAMYRDPVANRPPGGEPLESFGARIAAAYERQVAAHPGRHLLIVCHAGVMRAVAGHVLAAPAGRWYRLRIDYAGVMRVRHGTHAPSLECLNAPRIPEAAP